MVALTKKNALLLWDNFVNPFHLSQSNITPSSAPSMDMPSCQLILYACPTGSLAYQIEDYLQDSQKRWGINKAHQYMPHCTLTGFFHDQEEAIALYLQTLESLMLEALKTPAKIQITDLLFKTDWHGLMLESPWLQSLTQAFAEKANSPTRMEALRLKTWLHVSLAYGFDPEHSQGLKQLALERVDPNATVGWEVRFYERLPEAGQSQTPKAGGQTLLNEWRCHGRWEI